MNRKIVLLICLVPLVALVLTSCSGNKDLSKSVTATVAYKAAASESDFAKSHDVYSAETDIQLEKDNYYLVKVACTFKNDTAKTMSGIEFVPYSSDMLTYDSEGIDIAPSYDIEPGASKTVDAYIYVDKSLDSADKINEKLNNTKFEFKAFLYEDVPVEDKSSTINFDGTFEVGTVNSAAADISITLSTQNESTYKITLDKDRNLNTYVYENQSKDYSSNESVQLSQEQYDSLMEQVNSLGEFKENTNSAAYDYWVVNLNVNSEEHNFTYGLAANENYDKLVQSIVELSPIKAVDSQGNGIVPFQAENN